MSRGDPPPERLEIRSAQPPLPVAGSGIGWHIQSRGEPVGEVRASGTRCVSRSARTPLPLAGSGSGWHIQVLPPRGRRRWAARRATEPVLLGVPAREHKWGGGAAHSVLLLPHLVVAVQDRRPSAFRRAARLPQAPGGYPPPILCTKCMAPRRPLLWTPIRTLPPGRREDGLPPLHVPGAGRGPDRVVLRGGLQRQRGAAPSFSTRHSA